MTRIAESVIPAANTDTLLYANTTTNGAAVNISVCHKTGSVDAAYIAIGSGSSPEDKDWIVYNSSSFVQRAGEIMKSGEKIWVKSNSGNVSFRVCGVAS